MKHAVTSNNMALARSGVRPLDGSTSININLPNCEEIESIVRLTPPSLVIKLCKGERLPPVSAEAIFVEELLEIARKLNKMHFAIIIKGDP